MALAQRDPKAKAVPADPNPLYACAVVYAPDDKDKKGVAVVKSWMAFDPRYGPETQEQLDWHIANEIPGANQWEVGKACHNFR